MVLYHPRLKGFGEFLTHNVLQPILHQNPVIASVHLTAGDTYPSWAEVLRVSSASPAAAGYVEEDEVDSPVATRHT